MEIGGGGREIEEGIMDRVEEVMLVEGSELVGDEGFETMDGVRENTTFDSTEIGGVRGRDMEGEGFMAEVMRRVVIIL